VIKEIPTHLRGRAPGEIPRIIRAALLAARVPESALVDKDGELEAAEYALKWARPGDVLGLLVHASVARAAVLERLSNSQ
jgi:cyanophycin synthetase